MLLRSGKRKCDLNEEIGKNKARKLVKSQLSSLPLELKMKIIKNLTYKDQLSLRTVNKYYQSLIDTQKGTLNDLKLRLDIKKNNKKSLYEAAEFLNRLKKINLVTLLISDEIKGVMRKIKSFKDPITSLTLRIPKININSLKYLNVLSQSCEELKIDKFTRNVDKISMDTIIDKLDLRERCQIKFQNLKRLCINFNFMNQTSDERIETLFGECSKQCYDSDLDETFEDSSVQSETTFDSDYSSSTNTSSTTILSSLNSNVDTEAIQYSSALKDYFLLYNERVCWNILDSFELNKEKLYFVYLENYHGSLKSLLKLISGATLDSLTIKSSLATDYPSDYFQSYKCKISSKYVNIDCPEETLKSIFLAHLDYSILESLTLSVFNKNSYLNILNNPRNYDEEENNDDFDYEFTDLSDNSFIVRVFQCLDSQLKYLFELYLRIKCLKAISITGFKFPSSLRVLSLQGEYFMREFYELARDLIQFKDDKSSQFEDFEINLSIECFLQSDIDLMVSSLRELASRFPSLKVIKLNIICDHNENEDEDDEIEVETTCLLKSIYKMNEKKEFILKDFFDSNLNKSLKIFVDY
jgi:hypothetical protein